MKRLADKIVPLNQIAKTIDLFLRQNKESGFMERHAWDYAKFKTAFYLKTGLELDRYKDKQMERRIRQLMERENQPVSSIL